MEINTTINYKFIAECLLNVTPKINNNYNENDSYNIINNLLDIYDEKFLKECGEWKNSSKKGSSCLYLILLMLKNIKSEELLKDIIITGDYLSFVTSSKNGYPILNKLNKYIKKFISNNSLVPLDYINSACAGGTYKTFIYWYKLGKVTCYHNSIVNANMNKDIRIFKFIIDKYAQTDNADGFIKHDMSIVRMIFSNYSGYKTIIKKIDCLKDIMNSGIIISILSRTSDDRILSYVHKNYHRYHNFVSLGLLIKKLIDNTIMKSSICANTCTEIINNKLVKLFNYLEDENQKYYFYFIIHTFINHKDEQNKLLNYKFYKNKMINIVNDNIQSILEYICDNHKNFFVLLNNDYFRFLFKIIKEHDYFTQNLDNYFINDLSDSSKIINDLILFKKFYSPPNIKDIKVVNCNKLSHLLRLKMKRVYNLKIYNSIVKKYKLHIELLNYEPNLLIPVLRSGSLNYQYNVNQFPANKILPDIVDKYDKIHTSFISSVCSSYNCLCKDMFKDTRVSAYYIEELDVYLVVDIDIKNTTIKERGQILLNEFQKNEINNYHVFPYWFPIL
jgi:hypothetical protein